MLYQQLVKISLLLFRLVVRNAQQRLASIQIAADGPNNLRLIKKIGERQRPASLALADAMALFDFCRRIFDRDRIGEGGAW